MITSQENLPLLKMTLLSTPTKPDESWNFPSKRHTNKKQSKVSKRQAEEQKSNVVRQVGLAKSITACSCVPNISKHIHRFHGNTLIDTYFLLPPLTTYGFDGRPSGPMSCTVVVDCPLLMTVVVIWPVTFESSSPKRLVRVPVGLRRRSDTT